MKSRILFLLTLVAFSVLSLSSFWLQPVSAAVLDDAQAFCTSTYGSGGSAASNQKLVTDCRNGYIQEKKVAAGVVRDTKDHYCKTTPAIDYSACAGGWDGAAGGSSSPVDAALSSQITTACSIYSGSDFNDCKAGVTGQSNGTSQTSSCKNAKDKSICGNAWTAAKNRIDPSKLTVCKDKSGQAQVICVYGYQLGDKGASNDTGCNIYVDTAKLKARSICQDAYKQGKQSNDSRTKAAKVDAANTGNADEASAPNCESSGFNLGFIFCPIINGLATATQDIYNDIVQPLLETKPIEINDPAHDPTHAYAIWSNFRIYGDIFLVISLLVIVFGEAIGGGLIDAYTVKKVLPRLLVAAVLINLSIYIVAFAVDVTNVIGGGVESLIEAPFKNAGAFRLHVSGGTSDLGMVAMVAGIFAAKALISGALAEFLLLFFLIPAFLTFIAIMITVMVRRGLILFLILISPIAFALYCLPNTEQYFRKWWDLLWRTLIVYPIIAAIFGLANVLSVTIDTTTSGIAKSLADFVSILALFVPLFLIPYSFRIAGGLLARLHETATTMGKRGFDMAKGNPNNPDSWGNKVRGKMRQRAVEKGLTGRSLATHVVPTTNPFTPTGRAQRRRNIEARREADRMKVGGQYAEADAVFQANKGNDQYLLAVANRGMAEENLADIKRNKGAGWETKAAAWESAIAAANITHGSPAVKLQAANALASTGFQFATGQQGYNELAETIAGITGAELVRDGNNNVIGATGRNAGTYANSMNFAQYSARSGGRFDLGGINNGTGYNFKQGVGKGSGYTVGQAKTDTYYAGAQQYFGAGGDEVSAEAMQAGLQTRLNSGSVNVQDVSDWHETLLDSLHSATGINRGEIEKQLSVLRSIPDSPEAAPLKERIAENEKVRRRGLSPDEIEASK